jgi:hypothetical protein
MFGHQDDHDDTSSPPAGDGQDDIIKTDRPAGEPDQPEAAADPAAQPDPTAADPSPPADPAWQHPGKPISDDEPAGPQPDQPEGKEQISDVISPAGGFPKRPTFSYQTGAPDLNDSLKHPDDMIDGPIRDLIDIRQKAVGELVPIIDKLDLPPLEKFRTIMMIIQVSDDEALVKAAYAAAHSITDDKEKAQALLDIVNEVNYFTHQPEPEN